MRKCCALLATMITQDHECFDVPKWEQHVSTSESDEETNWFVIKQYSSANLTPSYFLRGDSLMLGVIFRFQLTELFIV